MTTLREHIYSLMEDNLPLNAAVHDTLLARGSFEAAPQTRPFLIYAFGVQRATPRWAGPKTLDLIVYIHDNVGDYLVIDATLDLVDQALVPAPSASDGSGFMACNFVERSSDFQDNQLNTFYRFARYQVVSSF